MSLPSLAEQHFRARFHNKPKSSKYIFLQIWLVSYLFTFIAESFEKQHCPTVLFSFGRVKKFEQPEFFSWIILTGRQQIKQSCRIANEIMGKIGGSSEIKVGFQHI